MISHIRPFTQELSTPDISAVTLLEYANQKRKPAWWLLLHGTHTLHESQGAGWMSSMNLQSISYSRQCFTAQLYMINTASIGKYIIIVIVQNLCTYPRIIFLIQSHCRKKGNTQCHACIIKLNVELRANRCTYNNNNKGTSDY